MIFFTLVAYISDRNRSPTQNMPRNSRLGGDGAEGEDVAMAVAAAEGLAGGEVRVRVWILWGTKT